MEDNTTNKVIAVLGMHRGGTSAITRSLQVLGIGLGENLLPESFDNPKGFWEDRDCIAINEELLNYLGSSFDHFDLAWDFNMEIPVLHPLYVKARNLVSESILKNKGVWGVKDPRMCRLLGFWENVFNACDCTVNYVIAIRNPMSVAVSLEHRNHIPVEKGYFLWLQHMVPAILDSHNKNRVVVDYDLLVESPEKQISRLAGSLKIPFDVEQNDLLREFSENFLEDGLRHSKFSLSQLSSDSHLPYDVLKAYTLLLSVAQDEISINSIEVQTGFKQIEANLKAYSPAFTYANILEEKLYSEKEQYERNVQTMNARIMEYEQAAQTLNTQLMEGNQAIQKLNARLLESNQAIQALSVQMQSQLAEKDAQLAEKDAQLAEKDAQFQEIIHSKAWRIVLFFRLILSLIAPPNSKRMRLIRQIINIFVLPITKIVRNPKLIKNWVLIKFSGFFDKDWYLVNNSDVAQSKIDPLFHYLLFGGFEGRDPSQNFSSAFYLYFYEDVKNSGINPLVHYLVKGRGEGRQTSVVDALKSSDLFDPDWYLAHNPEVAQSKLDPLTHYLQIGGFEGRDPSPNFSSAFYLYLYEDVKNSGINPLVHYLVKGKWEGHHASAVDLLKSSDLFDPDWYLAQNPEVTQAKLDPFIHYLQIGGFTGRDPSPNFSSSAYLDSYEDVKEIGVNPLVHYLGKGMKEGRIIYNEDMALIIHSGLFDRTWYLINNPDVAEVKLDPFLHYFYYGGIEGRDPGPNFSTARYLDSAFEDVSKSGVNPLLHYLKQVRDDDSRDYMKPLVSIVIPVFNAVAMTRACIESIYQDASPDIPFEVIIVDNASKDGTADYLKAEKKKRAHFEVLSMDQNIGFGPAVNEGMRRSKSEFIVILNNDTLVAPKWLDHLLAAMRADAGLGIVSPVTNYVGEGPQIDEKASKLSADLDVIRDYANGIAQRKDIFYEPNRLVFFCVMLKRELIDIIGYLDVGYEKGNFEDDDYCLRARMSGYRLGIARNSFVYHHGSVTFASNQISHAQFMEKNRIRFYKKTGRISTSLRQFSTGSLTGKEDVSVILRTKDRSLLLQRALTSLANQTFRDFEVVLVNDGGEDVSGLVHSFAAQFPIKHVYHQVSKGRTAAINAGFQNSKGKWICYLDDDDILYPWHLEVLFKSAENSKSKFVYSDYNRALFLEARMTTPDVLKGVLPWEYSRRELLIQNYIPIHTWMHARECAEKVGLWDESLDRLEDYEFLIRLSADYSFHHLKKVTCEYRYYVDSANSIYTDRHRTLSALEQIYERNPVEDSDSRIRRQEVLDTIDIQIHKIREIQEQSGVSIPEDRAIRDIIRLVTSI